MSEITCLHCKQPFEAESDQCPHCGERVTSFQRTYSGRLLDGKYQIVDRLGVGGMGEIFKVRHIHLNELRVIKIMRPNIAADDQGMQRFLQEARTSTMIKHRNLAMLYDFAQLDDGSYYMVWEFIDGTNIQKWIALTGAVPPRLTVEIAVQALHGLDHLHSMGLIHRDISPENIMLSQDHNGKLLVKVIDFGIAKQLAEGDGGHGLTQTGMFLGKLKYASPEQAGFLKEGEHIDARSDLYSFGIVMYEMVSGRAPFNATNPQGYILKHVTEKPVPISEANPAVSIPASLEAIIMKSLEKSRDNRFASAADFAQALEAIRFSIAPEEKYGLGDRMVTLSGAQTLADLPKVTSPASTVGGVHPTQQGSTFVRGSTVPARAAASASPRTVGSNDATVVEQLDRQPAGPTQIESKMMSGGLAPGEPTVLEPRTTTAGNVPKRNPALLAAMAAAIVLILLIGAYFAMRKPQPVVATTNDTSGTVVTAIGTTTVAVPPASSGQGLLLLSASPWGDLDRIVSKSDRKEVELSDDLRSTPARIPLEAGGYLVTVNGPAGRQETIDVTIEAGKPSQKHISMGNVDFDALTREVSKP